MLPWLVILAAVIGGTSELRAQEGALEEHCALAERFMVESRNMVALSEPDTISDWRTRRSVPGCRITAAGITTLEMDSVAGRFFDRLMAAGWTRTPDPRDAPNESSIRFRRGASDCLFNFYYAGHLGTPADIEVSSAVVPGPGETRYNIFVMCIPAMDAALRRRLRQQT